jgi:hypothetical protein
MIYSVKASLIQAESENNIISNNDPPGKQIASNYLMLISRNINPVNT